MSTKDDGTVALDESDPALAETLAVAEPAEPVLEAPPGEPVPAVAEAAPETPPAAPPGPIADDDGTAFLLFARDGLDSPIADLTVTVDVPGQPPVTRTTDAQGAIGLVLEGPMEGEAKVAVKDLTGQQQHICTLDLAQCREGAVLRSPKVHVPIRFEPHRGEPAKPASAKARAAPAAPAVPAPPKHGAPASPPALATAVDEPWWAPALSKARHWLDSVIGDTPLRTGPPGAPPIIARARNLQGNPVIVAAGPECPNKDRLLLGENNAYREAILEAAKCVGIDPRAIAALIGAEAAREEIFVPVLDDKGQPVLIKSGEKKGQPLTAHRGTRWKVDSAASSSKAVGLTQFIPGTWLGLAMTPSHLNEQCRAKGWIFDAERTRTVGTKQEKYVQQQFRLSATSSTFDPAQPRYFDPKNSQYLEIQNIQDCLNLRNDPTCSILTAADYAVQNLKRLAAEKGFKTNGLTDAEKAKLIYLMHHEGPGVGIAFLHNSKHYSKTNLTVQIGAYEASRWINSVIAAESTAEQAGELKEAGDGTIQQTTKAYRGWLADYINTNINLNIFSCVGGLDNPKLSEIAVKIGGAEVVYVEPPMKPSKKKGKAQ